MGNGWNLRQPTWLKPNNVKSEKMSSFSNIDDANNKEYYVVMLEDVDENLERMRIEEEPPNDDEIQLSKHLMNLKALPTSKALKLYTYSIVLDIHN